MVNTLIVCFGDFLNIDVYGECYYYSNNNNELFANFIVSSLKIFTSLFGKCFIVMWLDSLI